MPKRNKLIQQLIEYVPTTAWEQTCVNQISTFVSQNKNCFDRELSEGHITGSAWLLNQNHTKALLTHHRKLGMWLQLGGHADGEHDVLEVALREAIEESGIADISPITHKIFDVDVHKIPANSKEEEHYHYDIRYLFQTNDAAEFTISDESLDLKWVSKAQAREMELDTSVMRMFEKVRWGQVFSSP